MKKVLLYIMCLTFCITISISGFASDLEYKFDNIKLVTLMEFTAKPATQNSSHCNWLYNIAGDSISFIDVKYGRVYGFSSGLIKVQDDFIEVTGVNGSQRYLLNTSNYKEFDSKVINNQINSLFISSKVLNGNSILKSDSAEIKSITMHRDFLDDQLIALKLGFSDNGLAVSNAFSSNYAPDEVVYVADAKTVKSYIKEEIWLQPGNQFLFKNGLFSGSREIDPDVATTPVIVNSRTLTPMGILFEELGGTFSWDEKTKSATIKANSKTIALTMNNKSAFVNGEKKYLDVAPKLMNSRPMLPLRFVMENLGYKINWDSKLKIITINY